MLSLEYEIPLFPQVGAFVIGLGNSSNSRCSFRAFDIKLLEHYLVLGSSL